MNNGSFEDIYNCAGPLFPIRTCKHWTSIDSVSYAGEFFSICNSKIPLNGNTFQFPKQGNAYIISTQFYINGSKGYLKNRLKHNLRSGKAYCIKFYVNIANTSPYGIDGFGAYFGDNTIDTITKCTIPLTYLNPQVKNPLGNVIKDTLNWVPITGTFVANGTEKYMLIGNFLADNAVTTASIGGPYYPAQWTDVLFDDVSCIELNVDAYAGPDRSIKPGDSAYVGRERDYVIDTCCKWFRLPGMVPLDTVSGLWVKPVTTTTYVVRQEIECGSVKWDTVVVHMDLVGMEKLQIQDLRFKIWPNPANDLLTIEVQDEGSMTKDLRRDCRLQITDCFGRMMREEEIEFKGEKAQLATNDLESGVYFIFLKGPHLTTVSKRFVIAR